MIEIDGSIGDGGGQVLRTALAMSLVKRTPIRVRNIRAGRPKQGLRSWHVATIKAAALVGGDADVEDAEVGSGQITFSPRGLLTGSFRFDVGKRGGTAPLLQVVLPALLVAPAPSAIIVEGITHHPLLPTFEILDRACFPLLGRMGATVVGKLDRVGFEETAGGKVRVEVRPSGSGKLEKLHLLERGEVVRRRAYACVVELPTHIVERELKVIKQKLGWNPIELRGGDLGRSRNPGNVVYMEIESEHATEVIAVVGAKDVRAEQVAGDAAAETARYLKSGVPVGDRLAEQLLVPMAVAGGGSFRTLALTRNARTQLEVLNRYFGVTASATEQNGGAWLVKLKA